MPAMQFITLEIDFTKKPVNIFWLSESVLVLLGKEKRRSNSDEKN